MARRRHFDMRVLVICRFSTELWQRKAHGRQDQRGGIFGHPRCRAEACRYKGYLHTTVCSYHRHVLGNAVIIFIYSTYVPGLQNLFWYLQVVLLHIYKDILRLMVQTYSI
jgi:hypothetical protein